MSKKVIVLILVSILSIATIVGCTSDKKEDGIEANYKSEEYIYNGEREIEIEGRGFQLEDIPENIAEETVINDFKYSIVGDFKNLSNILADTEALNISIENQEKDFNEGNYIQSYIIHEISTLSKDEYNQEKLEDGKYNPYHFYGWEENVKEYNLKEYEIINVKFTQKHSDKSIELGPQWGNGTFNRNFLVGKSSKDNNYKIYEFGIM